MLLPGLLAVGCMMLVGTATAPSQDSIPPAVRQLIESGRLPGARWPDFARYVDPVARLYHRSGGFVWLDGPAVSRPGHAAVTALLKAGVHGLNPSDYDAALLEAAARRSVVSLMSAPERARFDVALTVNLMRLLDDLQTGRLHPGTFDRGREPGMELAGVIEAAVAADSIQKLLAAMAPQLAQYRNLQRQLARYRQLGLHSLPAASALATSVERGDSYPGSGALRRRLIALGDLAADAGSDDFRYGSGEEQAVRSFQARHGLEPTGVLDSVTLREINTPFERRVRQIELALERLRWLPPIGRERFIVVNIPAFQLFAFDSVGGSGAPSLTMRVIVGQALEKETPVMYEQLRSIEFRPYWNVPRGVVVDEILPMLRSDSGYLSRNDMELVAAGNVVTEGPLTPEVLEQLAAGTLRLRQRPGPRNALGLVKFVFPNAADVYLHGTPQPELFGQTRRDFSHGCIRLENPTALAVWALSDRVNWSRDRIAAAEKAASTTRALLERPMPVIIFYTTAVASPDSNIWFYSDIYGHDRRLDEALKAGPPTP